MPLGVFWGRGLQREGTGKEREKEKMIEKEEEEEGGGGEITTTFSIFHKRKCGRRVATQLTRLTLVKSTSKST